MSRPSFSPERSALRGLGASGVVFDHAAQLASFAFAGAAGWLAYLGGVGWLGVGLFLALSIYLLMGSLDRSPRDLRGYFLRRIVRIWPLYFATCGVLFVLFDRSLTDLAYNLTFLAVWTGHGFHNTVTNGWPGTYVVWTLQIEEWAYLCFPAIAVLSHRRRMLVGVALCASFGLGAVVPFDYFTPYPWLACYGIGLLAYQVGDSLPAVPWSVLLAEVPVALFVGWPWGLTVAAPLLAYVLARPPRLLARWPLVAVGEGSYALYLTHLLLLEWLGWVGLALAYPMAWAVESLQRGRQMVRRVRSSRV